MAELRTDQELLRNFAEVGSEAAFQSLVQRHINLVFATALRGLGDASAAQEITQNVFIALARKAPWLRGEVGLAGWLHKTAVLETRQWWRSEWRRRRREQTAVELGATMKEEDSLLKSLTGVLDEGLLELREPDRQALMLRYLEEQSHREVGAQLGIGEDAARKRIDKALGQLTRFFQRRGYAVPAVATTAIVLRDASVHAAPVGLAAAASKAAVCGSGVATLGSLGLYLGKFMALTKTQTVAVCVVLAAAPVAYEWHTASAARSGQKLLRAQVAQTQDEIAARQRALEQTSRRLRSTEFALGQVRAQAARPAVAAIVDAGNPGLYLWDESSDYVRLPKQMLQHLTLRAAHKQGKKAEDPVSVRNGTLSSALAQALGVTPDEEAGVQAQLQAFHRAYQQFEQAFRFPTNQPLDRFHVGDNESYTLVTGVFPEHGEMLKQELRTALELTLGAQRAEVVWQQAEEQFRTQYNDFGALERLETVALLLKDKRVGYWKAARRPGEQQFYDQFGSHMPIETATVPEVFRPLVDEWKNRFKPQTAAYE